MVTGHPLLALQLALVLVLQLALLPPPGADARNMRPPAGAKELKQQFKEKHEDGAVYSGEFNDASPPQKHGPGRYTWPDDSYYDGMWQNDERDGMGLYRYPSGATYDGAWKKNQPNGHGTYTWCDSHLTAPQRARGCRPMSGIAPARTHS
jgi:hypothetical protein